MRDLCGVHSGIFWDTVERHPEFKKNLASLIGDSNFTHCEIENFGQPKSSLELSEENLHCFAQSVHSAKHLTSPFGSTEMGLTSDVFQHHQEVMLNFHCEHLALHSS